MKMLASVLALLWLVLLPARAVETPAYAARAAQLPALLREPGEEQAFFSTLFLDAVPLERWRAIAAGLRSRHGKVVALGAVRQESATAGQVEVRYETATVGFTMVVAPQSPNRVVGLHVIGIRLNDDNMAKLTADIAALPGTASFAIAQLTDKGPVWTYQQRADAQMATGSSFKLYILAELARTVAAGERHWSDVIPLGPKSFSGRLMHWPTGRR